MIVDDPRIIKYISPNDGSKGQLPEVDSEVQHQTYGSEGGDLSVGLYGVGFTWYITLDGRIFQLWDTNSITWHCNGANRRARGREYESPAGGPLTQEQIDAGGYLTALEIRLGLLADHYVDPETTERASIHVNEDYNFHGGISHRTVMTDDGSSQHSDLVTMDEWNRMRSARPTVEPVNFVSPIGEPTMCRTILVNGGIDTFEIDKAGAIWWHHVDHLGQGHPSVKISGNGDPDNRDIDMTATIYGPFLTARMKSAVGTPPEFLRIIIKGYGYVAEKL